MESKLSKESKYKIKIVAGASIVSGILFLTGFQLISGNFHGDIEPANKLLPLENSTSKEPERTPEQKVSNEESVPQTIESNQSGEQNPQPSNLPSEEPIKSILDKNSKFKASTWFSDYSAMIKNIKYYHEVHPFIYTMKGGMVNTGELISMWSKTSRKERVEEMRRLNPDVLIIPTIFRWENPKEKISENIGMNGRNDIREKHIHEIINEIETYGYDGIDIDYEGMTCNKKEKFEEFIILLSKELKARKKILSVALHPKTSASQVKVTKCNGLNKPITQDFAENWRGPLTHDYAFLGKYADKIKIMAYELHPRKYRNPGPGPQAPNVWLKSIIEYAKERIPSEKLYMAIPTYGYDWALNCNTRAKAVYWDTAVKIRSNQHSFYQPTNIPKILSEQKNSKTWKNLTKFIDIHENKIYEDPSLWYHSEGCDRVAFFMNKKAFEEKMTLLRKYDLAGFSFWQLLSNNDPSINDYLSLLVTNKLPPVKNIEIQPIEKIAKKDKSSKDESGEIPFNDEEVRDAPENGNN